MESKIIGASLAELAKAIQAPADWNSQVEKVVNRPEVATALRRLQYMPSVGATRIDIDSAMIDLVSTVEHLLDLDAIFLRCTPPVVEGKLVESEERYARRDSYWTRSSDNMCLLSAACKEPDAFPVGTLWSDSGYDGSNKLHVMALVEHLRAPCLLISNEQFKLFFSSPRKSGCLYTYPVGISNADGHADTSLCGRIDVELVPVIVIALISERHDIPTTTRYH